MPYIPVWFLGFLIGRIKRVLEHAICDPSDTRTANAMRLLGHDLQKLKAYHDKELEEIRNKKKCEIGTEP